MANAPCANAGYTWKARTVNDGNRPVAPAPAAPPASGFKSKPKLRVVIYAKSDNISMKMAQSPRKYGQTGSFSLPTKLTSMCSLIIWNISKVLEKDPCMDLRHAMRSAHERFDRESRDELEMISQTPEERHLTCAILAWQQLGHKDTDSLYQFIEQNRNKPVQQSSENSNNANIDIVNKSSIYSKPRNDFYHEQPVYSKDIDSSNFDTKSLMGPVVKLPVETKIIMRMESTPCSHHTTRKTQKNPNDIMNKIDAACCMDSACVQRLADLDTAVCELRSRAAKLARREAERVELLERAEAAWKDLELGFQRRLGLALEKEDDITKQIKKTIEERNGYKSVCTELAKNVKELAQVAEEERDSLTLVEKDLCERACVRLRLSEEAARGDSALAEQLCKASQMDRDLQFKEDQVRRKVSSLESEIQSARCLTHEAEIALRGELGMLKEQITQVSNQLLNEESEVKQIKLQLTELRTEKVGLLEDLDGCKTMCDNRMQGKVNELKQKREELMKLKEKVIECRCKIPLDEAIDVKRTPSLAALCQCISEEKLLDTCSCTSIRTQLLSTLLSDLFGGLQSELSESGSTMPCQLLKCLEDKHNWDRSSVVKSNLRNFFEQLLVGELDIAIATSIEKYHAKWIGKSCVDRTQVMPYSVEVNDAAQEQDIERRAQKMATKLAEQLFNERADQITKRAKEIISKGPPPCECRPQPAVFQCLVKRPNTTHIARKNTESPPSYFKRTLQDVTQLKVQVEDLRKESVKKEDLRQMEGKIARIVKRASKQNNIPLTNKKIKRIKDVEEKKNENTFQNGKTLGQLDISENKVVAYSTKQNIIKSNQYGVIENKKKKILKKIEQSFAVNLCLCGTRDNSMQDPPQKDNFQVNISKNKMETISSYKMSQISPEEDADTQANKFSTQTSCPSECVCFHKIPSNTSIEKLLDTLLNRKGDKNDVLYKSILYNQSKENQTNDNNLSQNLSDDIKQNKSTIYLPVNGIDKILIEDNINPTFPCDLVPECCSNGHDIGTNYDVYPNTTNSEYIGTVNLDKNQIHKIQTPNSCKLDFKKESQVYSVQANSRFKSVDKESHSNSINKKDLEVCGNSYVGDVLKKSDLLSDDCDYYVKFLGVTLTNAIKNTKEIDEMNTISTFTNLGNDNLNNLEAMEIKNDITASISSNLVKEQLEVPKNAVTKTIDSICTNHCSGYKLNCSYVCPMEICNKSAVGTKYEKNDPISKMEDKPDVGKKRNKPNILSRLFICWICPVLYRGNKRDIEEDDLIIPSKQYDSDRLGGKFERYWLEEYDRALRENRKPSLVKALTKAYWLAYLPGAFLLLINATARTVQPLLFSELLSYWSANASQSITRQEAGFYAIGMLALNLVGALSQHHNNLFVNRFSLKVKVACSSLIYRKILRMNQLSISEVAAGKLVNILSNDVARFDMAFMFLHYLWLVPLQLAIVMYFLYEAAGYAPYVGLFGVVLLVLPIQACLTKLTAVIRRNVAQRTDKRIKLMSEIINGIQVIKMYAWEKSFQHVVKVARAFELAALRKSIFVRSVFLGFMMFAERSTLFLTALTFILSGNLLRADMIYPIKVFLGIVQMNLSFILPLAIASLSELKVSLGRIQNVLIMDEREDLSLLKKPTAMIVPVVFKGKMTTIDSNSIVAQKYSTKENSRLSIVSPRTSVVGETMVELSGVSASWDVSKSPEEMTLKNITMHLKKGKLCAIIGAVGSGKSSLLQVLLRELPVNSGNLTIKGSMSYACQESWLFPATVRENILFGLPYDVNRYKEVCRVCSLLPDFKQFPYGDLSLVGERGVSLSGGQRARINLARAVYREADIYLLDDPLSAVDAKVGRQLFDGCIKKYLSGRTRILVTHQVHFLKAADFIIVLSEGSIKNMGSYDDLVKSEKEFSSLISDDKENKDDRRPTLQHRMSRVSVRSDNKDTQEEKEQVLEAEERAKGNLKWAVVKDYLMSVKSWLVVFMAVFSLLLTQTGATFSDYWLSYWTNQVDEYEISLPPGEEPDTSLGTQVGPLTTGQYLWIYGGAVLFIIIMTQVRIAAFVVMAMRASQNLHDTMFKNLLTAVMRFFDTNPSGRVLNRFSKDMDSMDEMLPRSMLETIQMYLFVTSVLVLNALALPWTLIPTAILLLVFVILLKWYLNAAQAVKRLESTTKSPVFSMINSTMSGLSTVRSSNSQYRLLKMFDDAQDLNSSAFYTFLGGSSAFGLFLDILCLVYLGVILAIFILIDFGDWIAVGSVGLAVSQSMTLTMMLQMAARVTADLLAHMTSVERILEYSNLPAEENMDDGPTQPPPNWPSDGQIRFENVSLKYGLEDPPVLKDLNFTINSGWKVGIVGRTGAGKSSLMSALFRLSNIEGSIEIDGVDTRGISKKELRSNISVIPQEPVLFSATLRYNLDPFNLYSDDEIWKALEQVELKDAVPALDFHVTEGGTNFSVGQRQLVCLARAVLRDNKILVMDEATANVDPQTDALIQRTIRRQFASCTVLTIAHRLHTVMDSDRVLVMDKGRVAEFDHPYILLSNPSSLLNYMVKETGEGMSNALYETAKAKFQSEVS
ncbi:uncharacterized protein LOC126774816 [Nymphalis io]|uniref:uncharacterized protein LOC126774816 n=1 Tax=Inachis io TaxID=171585 RepID=UPI00216A82DA|nr:uncharacterized protein LOC126774816 [Nymphalis io]